VRAGLKLLSLLNEFEHVQAVQNVQLLRSAQVVTDGSRLTVQGQKGVRHFWNCLNVEILEEINGCALLPAL
jgi:hypothetical protein